MLYFVVSSFDTTVRSPESTVVGTLVAPPTAGAPGQTSFSRVAAAACIVAASASLPGKMMFPFVLYASPALADSMCLLYQTQERYQLPLDGRGDLFRVGSGERNLLECLEDESGLLWGEVHTHEGRGRVLR